MFKYKNALICLMLNATFRCQNFLRIFSLESTFSIDKSCMPAEKWCMPIELSSSHFTIYDQRKAMETLKINHCVHQIVPTWSAFDAQLEIKQLLIVFSGTRKKRAPIACGDYALCMQHKQSHYPQYVFLRICMGRTILIFFFSLPFMNQSLWLVIRAFQTISTMWNQTVVTMIHCWTLVKL